MPSAPAPATPRRRRVWVAVALASAGVCALAALAWSLAVRQLEQGLRDALGPRGSVAELTWGWEGVALRDLRIDAARGWPATRELQAKRVLVQPDLWAALGGRLAIGRLLVEEGYVSLLRERNGRLRLLPALLDAPPSAPAADEPSPSGRASHAFQIGHVELRRCEVAFYDASVRQPPLAVRLTDVEATVGPLHVPAWDAAIDVRLRATVKGAAADGRSDGTLALDGSLTPATRDAALTLALRQVDLRALQPYLLRVAEGGVKRGRMDLDLKPVVKDQQLHAPGQLTLTGLELGSSGLAGVPRQAVLAFMTRNDRIELEFTLEGRLDDPAFSLNENLATRVASALADTLGVSVGGVVEGVGSVIRGLFGR